MNNNPNGNPFIENSNEHNQWNTRFLNNEVYPCLNTDQSVANSTVPCAQYQGELPGKFSDGTFSCLDGNSRFNTSYTCEETALCKTQYRDGINAGLKDAFFKFDKHAAVDMKQCNDSGKQYNTNYNTGYGVGAFGTIALPVAIVAAVGIYVYQKCRTNRADIYRTSENQGDVQMTNLSQLNNVQNQIPETNRNLSTERREMEQNNLSFGR